MCKQCKQISNVKLYVIKFVNKNNIVCVSSANQFLISNFDHLYLITEFRQL